MSKKPRSIYSNHAFGDIECPSISEKERKAFLNTARLAALQDNQEESEVDEEELMEMAGYGQFNESRTKSPKTKSPRTKSHRTKSPLDKIP